MDTPSAATRYPFACVSLPRMEILMSHLMSFDLWLQAMEPVVLARPEDWPHMLRKAMLPWAFTSCRRETLAHHFPRATDVVRELVEPTHMTDDGYAHLTLAWMAAATVLHTARASTAAFKLPPHRQVTMFKGQIASVMSYLTQRWTHKADSLLASTGHAISESVRTVIVRKGGGPLCSVVADISKNFDPAKLPDWEVQRLRVTGRGTGQCFLCPGYFVEGFDPYEHPKEA